jgi:hypothetical protein
LRYEFAGQVWDGQAAAADYAAQAPRPLIANATGTDDGAGRMVARFTAPPTVAWLVRRIVVQSTVSGQALVYVGSLIPENVVSGTITGEFDENDANQPYLVSEGVELAVVWANGGVCRARIEYQEV